jgi:hypothetical protein
MNRRSCLRNYGIASRARTLSPLFLERKTAVCEAAGSTSRINNWPNMNWTSLAAYYAAQGRPVAADQKVKDIINLNMGDD